MNFYNKFKNALTVLFVIFHLGVQGQTVSKFILTDQFGYRPAAKKTAVIKNPQLGFDNNESFTPGATYKVIDAICGEPVYEGTPVLFNGGATDEQRQSPTR